MNLQALMTARVRWPARPAELRAGLDFFFVILPDYPFVSRQKVPKSLWASKRKKRKNKSL